mmetsp:Transcript_56734/g.67963  ORF Transcript_56734/g.67963 Transcript_56734/m.67963 type:complete len:111 (-) Transcript_56734:123-455(-)
MNTARHSLFRITTSSSTAATRNHHQKPQQRKKIMMVRKRVNERKELRHIQKQKHPAARFERVRYFWYPIARRHDAKDDTEVGEHASSPPFHKRYRSELSPCGAYVWKISN